MNNFELVEYSKYQKGVIFILITDFSNKVIKYLEN